jgi:rSAM/selenodomain-associated transferase 1
MADTMTATAGPGSRVLGLFAKWPAAGAVKTRLAAGADPGWGARVAHAFLLDTVDRLAGVDARRVLAFAPAAAAADFAALVRGRFALTPQADGDLGRRLAGFVTRELDGGAPAVVVVGTDSPTLPAAYVDQAFRELGRADVVLGPAADGGYYLLGCGRRLPPVFEGIAWGSARVLEDTVARLADPGWRLALLPPWYDVDTPADWAMLRGHLAALRRTGVDPGVPHTEALIRSSDP